MPKRIRMVCTFDCGRVGFSRGITPTHLPMIFQDQLGFSVREIKRDDKLFPVGGFDDLPFVITRDFELQFAIHEKGILRQLGVIVFPTAARKRRFPDVGFATERDCPAKPRR